MALARAPYKVHMKCRNGSYLNGPARSHVPDDKVSWNVEFPGYTPVIHYDEKLCGTKLPVWADNRSDLSTVKFNSMDGKINRISYTGEYKFDESGFPYNPWGRTGMKGQGLLGRFGPNHAADPIVTRWKKDDDGNFALDSKGRRILEFVAIKRGDTGEWAIPGGMVEAGDSVSLTLRKEFGEEALNSLEASPEKRVELEKMLCKLFANGVEVYRGPVDDPRNTDNSWMETSAMNFHDEDGSVFCEFKLHAGDDAVGVKWVPITPDIKLYASHTDFVRNVYELRTGHEL
jgi:ADP-ribose pyrophosphatase